MKYCTIEFSFYLDAHSTGHAKRMIEDVADEMSQTLYYNLAKDVEFEVKAEDVKPAKFQDGDLVRVTVKGSSYKGSVGKVTNLDHKEYHDIALAWGPEEDAHTRFFEHEVELVDRMTGMGRVIRDLGNVLR